MKHFQIPLFELDRNRFSREFCYGIYAGAYKFIFDHARGDLRVEASWPKDASQRRPPETSGNRLVRRPTIPPFPDVRRRRRRRRRPIPSAVVGPRGIRCCPCCRLENRSASYEQGHLGVSRFVFRRHAPVGGVVRGFRREIHSSKREVRSENEALRLFFEIVIVTLISRRTH